jgi:hypothetical protein
MAALPIEVWDATATMPTAAPAPMKNFRREGLLPSIAVAFIFVFTAWSFFYILDFSQV